MQILSRAITVGLSAIVAIALFPFFSTQATLLPQRSQTSMVASASPLASEVGLQILRQGGNAVDAAVATTLAISVVEPFSAGIGGGGFLLYSQAGHHSKPTIEALDFRERAPLAATPDMYLDSVGNVRAGQSLNGHLAVAVPGTIAGLVEVHRLHGKLAWQDLVKPAIQLARAGIPVNQRFVELAKLREAAILQNPAAKELFTHNGSAYALGEYLKQPDLAKTLEAIARRPQDFYTGKIAEAIARDMRDRGGIVTKEDLKAYKPIWRSPLCGDFMQTYICSMPPPSSGGVHLLEILNMLGDGKSWQTLGWHHPDTLHFLTEAFRIAYADRAIHLGDPDFVTVPTAALISPRYAAHRRQEIDLHKATPSQSVKIYDPEALQKLSVKEDAQERYEQIGKLAFLPQTESLDTSHLTVIDRDRNAVSLTFTVNGPFGASVVVPSMGILLNNEMDDFAIAPNTPNLFGLVGGTQNQIAPQKTPLSSMTPVIAFDRDRQNLQFACGSSGGSTIITQVLQLVLHLLVYGMDAGAAMSAPRLHHQWLPDRLSVERWGLDIKTLDDLRQRGHKIEERSNWGHANLIVVKADGSLEGAADPRREGAVLGF
ncbi:gamma-glutamyltransferase [Tumidithrix elongata RA019]|uniref:Glutathione hydrolase proenzyme n=1 Tax=Tumidithrix elongata BACA0141 TaxID=2716417 RepID=A0AAW9PTR9_9CYAN|nr:gamma-glutamyltransferase [Tumidithrix elongata RA019]